MNSNINRSNFWAGTLSALLIAMGIVCALCTAAACIGRALQVANTPHGRLIYSSSYLAIDVTSLALSVAVFWLIRKRLCVLALLITPMALLFVAYSALTTLEFGLADRLSPFMDEQFQGTLKANSYDANSASFFGLDSVEYVFWDQLTLSLGVTTTKLLCFGMAILMWPCVVASPEIRVVSRQNDHSAQSENGWEYFRARALPRTSSAGCGGTASADPFMRRPPASREQHISDGDSVRPLPVDPSVNQFKRYCDEGCAFEPYSGGLQPTPDVPRRAPAVRHDLISEIWPGAP